MKLETVGDMVKITANGEIKEIPMREFNAKWPEIVGVAVAAERLEQTDFDILFRNELHPIQAEEVEIGDKVFVRAAKQFGQVIRKIGSAYRIDLGNGNANTYWETEFEKRS